MKKTIIICFIFLLTIFFAIFSTFDCKNKINKITEKTKTIEINLNKKNLDFLLKETNELSSIWHKYEKSFKIYLKRKNLESMGRKITNLEQNIKFLKIYDSKKTLNQINKICNEIINETKPIISNIL